MSKRGLKSPTSAAKSVHAEAQPVESNAISPAVVAAVAATATNVSGDATSTKPLATAKAVAAAGSPRAGGSLPVVTATDSGTVVTSLAATTAGAAVAAPVKPQFLPKKRKHSVEEAKIRHRAVERRRVLKINTCIAQIKDELEAIGLMVRKDKASILNSVLTFLRDYNQTNKNTSNGGPVAANGGGNAAAAAASPAVGAPKMATATPVVAMPRAAALQAQVAAVVSPTQQPGSAAKRLKKAK